MQFCCSVRFRAKSYMLHGDDASILTNPPMRHGIGPHLSEQVPDSSGLLTVSNLGHDGCETDTDSEMETLYKDRRSSDRPTTPNSNTSGMVPLVTSSTSDGLAQETAEPGLSTAVNTLPVNPYTSEYNYESCYEYPNGDVIETLQVLSENQVFRAKSIGWACLHLQSFKAVVRSDREVKVCPRRGLLKADSKTYQTVSARNRKQSTGAPTVEVSLERVDIVEKLCLGVYRCPYCDFVERPRSPLVGKNKNSAPRPPVRKRALEDRVLGAPERTASKLVICLLGQAPASDLRIAYHSTNRASKDRHDMLSKIKSKGSTSYFFALEQIPGISIIEFSSFKEEDGHCRVH
ncbi:hypothetical protein BGZ47_005518 [Haplosporangium gracile]|nr:hypothetical protein BGZ47_005518 [Haplosporangium gracile]